MLRLIGFGASSVQGVGDPEGGFFARIRRHAAAEGWSMRGHNFGVGGDTTRDMLPRTAALEPHRPYDLIVLLGSNDLPRPRDGEPARRTNLEEYATNVDLLLATICSRRSLFISSFVIAELATGRGAEMFGRYMQSALAAATRHGYDIWDLYAETKDGAVREYWAEDGIHFNAAGHAMLAERVLPWIERGREAA